MSENKEKRVTNYRKDEEHFVSSFKAASKLADTLFAPFGEKDAKGSRTTETAKVRIRARRRGKRGGLDQGFRVVLYKKSVIEEQPESKEEPTEEESPKRFRHRRDRKGRRRRRKE
jgi:hypothetical protein